VESLGAEWAGFYACPHLPEGINEYAVDCDCRKPAPGLLLRAAGDLRADLGQSWFVGDTWMDVAAGRSAGCRTILVGPDWRQAGSWPAEHLPDHAVPDLLRAAEIIVGLAGPLDPTGPRTTGPREMSLTGSAKVVR
jgi:histidinol phosphatase-like enzyme